MVRQGDLDGRGVLSTKGLVKYVDFMLKTALDQIDFMNTHLRLDLLSTRMEKFIRLSQEGFFEQEALPKYSEILLKELLIKGEFARGKVKEVIGTKDRTASALIKKLLELDYIESTTSKSAIRLKFNSFFASYLFPDLVPLH
jgi:Fic family protein